MRLRFVSLLIGLFVAGAAPAKVRLSQTKRVPIPTADFAPKTTSKDVANYIPLDMQASENSGYVASKVGDKTLQHIWNSPTVRNSSVGRTATTVEKKMRTDVTVKGSDPSKIDHKISVQMQALQTTAQVKYSGWVNGSMDYNVRDNTSTAAVSQKVMTNKDLVLSHTSADRGVTSLGMKWNF